TDLSLTRVPFLCGHITRPFSEEGLKLALDAALNGGRASTAAPLKTQTLHQTLASLSPGVIVSDLAGNVAYLNRQAEELTGWSLNEAAGEALTDVFQAIGNSTLKRRDGREITIETENVPLENPDGGLSGIATVFQEQTPTSRQESRNQKLEGLSSLARGFAHDFNNLLTILLGNLSMAQGRVTEDPELLYELELATGATLKAQGLVQQLMTFARGGTPVKGPVAAKELLVRIVEERDPRNGLRYEWISDFPEAVVHADPKQIRRLIENLLLNAEQAMNEGTIFLRGEMDGKMFLLEIIDSGHGLDPAVRDQAFEPFFTTRGDRNASGLGLTVCESIAQAHGGSVDLVSTPTEGTIATVRLPLVNEEQPMSTPNASSDAAPGGSGRILVLEDEELVSRLINATLSQAGYEVIETRDGEQTIEAYQQAVANGDPFNLLIMDLTIERGMGGVETMNRIKEIDPAARGIVSSGYSDDPAMSQPEDFGFADVLPKPYEPHELVTVVDKVLSS
ncbi:MAG: ATP-binding protein, partial [Verrucomicrobiota bacterium]